MPDADKEPYMVWECQHKTELTRTQWGANIPTVCEKCGEESGFDESMMGFKTSVPRGCAFAWDETEIAAVPVSDDSSGAVCDGI